MYTKEKIFNLALGALLLQRRIIDAATELNNENKVLNTHWDTALYATLEDLDLDGTSSPVTLALLESDPNDQWSFAYLYPSKCVLLRRIGMHANLKVIFCNEELAVAECIMADIPLTSLSASAGLAVAYRLAMLAAPLITGKGAGKLIEGIQAKYVVAKAEAQEKDGIENFNFAEDGEDSEFVEARLE